MKIQELLLELEGRFKARRTNQTYDAYTTWLYQHHERGVLGSGGSARVFDHPTNKDVAVKVFLAADVNYLDFANWCMRNKSNPWLPKIYDIQFFEHDSGEKYGIAFMERLEQVSPREYGKFLEDIGLDWHKFTDDQNGEMEKIIKRLKKQSEDPNLIKVLQYLYNTFAAYDLHKANFLKRGNQIVFVDPVAPPPDWKTESN